MLGLSHAVELNNQAVAQLQAGELKQAAAILVRAVASIRQVVFATTEGQENQGSCKLSADQRKMNAQEQILSEQNSVLGASFSSIDVSDVTSMDMDAIDGIRSLKGIKSVQTFRGSTAADDDDGSFFVSFYDHAFSINKGEQRDDLICTVVFYNLALVQHKRSMNHGRNLCKVLSIYDRAEIVAQNLPYSDDSILLLLLAIENNKMRIHATLYDRSSLQGSLLRMNMLVGERPSEEDDRFEIFVLNSICLAEEQWRCAAVA